MDELKYLDKPKFIKHFIAVTEGLAKEEIAVLVWVLLNKTWTDGQEVGKNEGGSND